MKKLFNRQRFIKGIDKLLDHILFRPIALSIIISFILFNGFSYLKDRVEKQNNFTSKKEFELIKIELPKIDLSSEYDDYQTFNYIFRSGDTLMQMLFGLGANEQDTLAILKSLKKVYNPRLIVSGQKVKIKYRVAITYKKNSDQDIENIIRNVLISQISISPSFEKKIVIDRLKDGSYKAKEVEIELTKKIKKASGTITDSLFVNGIASGASANVMMNLVNLYSFDVDFQRDIRRNDKFEVVYESYYGEDGEKVKDGEILFASLVLRGDPIDIYRFEVKGNVEYFDAKGRGIRKSLLRTPINGARISSGFGMRRHPVLGYSKMHKGLDFAAKRGTPILAAGNGVIDYYGRRGAYGKYVRIKHSKEYSTAYAHASRFARGLRRGSRVKQGQVIAYVGTTGRSTGPHLHYEILKYGKQINPSKVKTTSGVKLRGKSLTKFKKERDKIEDYRKNIPNNPR